MECHRARRTFFGHLPQRADAKAKERKRADDEKRWAIHIRDQALDTLRAATGTDVEKLIAAKSELSANEREYLEAIAQRWEGFAKQVGDDVETRELQVEGHFRVAFLWRQLKAGYKDAAGMKRDGDLDSVRDREDFRKLVSELEARPAAVPVAQQHGAP